MTEAGSGKREAGRPGRLAASAGRGIVAALAWVLAKREMRRESFVFGEQLGNWPVVRHTAPGRLVMIAPYVGPRRVQTFGGWKPPVLTGAAVAVLYWLIYRNISRTPEDLAGATAGAVFYCTLISIPLWRLARKTRLKIRFIDGEMIWRGPDWRIYRVPAAAERRIEAQAPHRWADEERRIQEQWRATHPGRGIPRPLFQTSSEVLLFTGYRGSEWLPVAEFTNDLGGQRALRLKNAIDFVMDRAAEELAARARERADAEAEEL
jgi:hypothetical protein